MKRSHRRLCRAFLLAVAALVMLGEGRADATFSRCFNAGPLLLAQATEQETPRSDNRQPSDSEAEDAAPLLTRFLQAAENPFTVQRLQQWFADHALAIVVIIAILIAVRFLIRFGARRLVRLIMRGSAGESGKDRENRIKTLVGVFESTATVVWYIGGALMILDTLGIPITALLGGVAVVGLAVAFGTQNLIKDYFSGFMILLEDQYHVNDVISIGGATGLVERITLRVTVLRSYEGVHFIPHGQITTVTNLTHKWARAVMDISVAYREDVDRVIDCLRQVGARMRQDERYGKLILEDLEVLGLDALGESSVVIKCFFKTEPIQQWTVRREFLRRVKQEFDARGIEIPFPQRVVQLRGGESAAS